MRYQNPQLRDQLAAEYVVGTLSRRARLRFQRLLKYDADLRRSVSTWEARLMPLAELVPEVTPPARVWRAIEARIRGHRAQSSFWASLGWWRGLAAISTAFVIVLATMLVTRQPAEESVSTVAVLADGKSQPAMVVAWPQQAPPERQQLRIRMLVQPELPPGKSFELWMLPGGQAAPVSLGVIRTDRTQTVQLTAAASQMLSRIQGMAVSVEPEGGSPTGAPTGPVILSGPVVAII